MTHDANRQSTNRRLESTVKIPADSGGRCFVANRFAGNLNLTNQVEDYMSTNDRFIQGGPQIASLKNLEELELENLKIVVLSITDTFCWLILPLIQYTVILIKQ